MKSSAIRCRYLTPKDAFHRVHTYFKGSPYHPDGTRVLYTRFRSLREPAAVCLLDRASGRETVLGVSRAFTYHSGANAWFCDNGRKVLFQQDECVAACHDLKSGRTRRFRGSVCVYSGNLRDRFIEIDPPCPLERQGRMSVHIRNIDGTGKRRLASVDELLEDHPQGVSIRQSGVRLRLGGEISPDRKKVILFLVTLHGTLIRDYYLCAPDGSKRVFHGRLGTHIMWHPNSRDVLAFVSPAGCSYFGHLRGEETAWRDGRGRYGLLASYDTHTRRMRILSERRIRGGCHVSPAPDGSRVVLDSLGRRLGILLFEYGTGTLRTLHTENRDRDVEPRDPRRLARVHGFKHYDVNAHPAFSRDSRRILYNSCVSGHVRPREIELPA